LRASNANKVDALSKERHENIIDGKSMAESIREDIKNEVERLKVECNVTPGLAVILVGSRSDSTTYVKFKRRACEEAGIVDFGCELPADVEESEILRKIDELNADGRVHGVLVQLPLPPHIDEARVLARITPQKDVDGLHPLNSYHLMNHNKSSVLASTRIGDQGKSSMFEGIDFHVPCTPQGCLELLDRMGVQLEGATAVVMGRSNIVGVPVSLLLMQRDVTVTMAHSRTKNIAELCRSADIIVAAVGSPGLVQVKTLLVQGLFLHS
jgi:5,10-methylene-tetrahydrofolate dehydrogenase/methenyl tetrahydrofolate cyclohydrolase